MDKESVADFDQKKKKKSTLYYKMFPRYNLVSCDLFNAERQILLLLYFFCRSNLRPHLLVTILVTYSEE